MRSRYWTIEKLPGLSRQEQALLKKYGIATTKDLLQKASSLSNKQALANQLQVKTQYVNKWVALADLARLPSVGHQYCGLLLHAGIASVTQLRVTPVHRLHQQILRLQVATTQRNDLCPSLEVVQQWRQEALAVQ